MPPQSVYRRMAFSASLSLIERDRIGNSALAGNQRFREFAYEISGFERDLLGSSRSLEYLSRTENIPPFGKIDATPLRKGGKSETPRDLALGVFW